MCARYVTAIDREEMQRIVDAVQRNIAAAPVLSQMRIGETRPTDIAPVCVNTPEGPSATLMRWGFPGFVNRQKPGVKPPPLLHARCERLESSSFSAYLGQRCLVPATAYYEWAAGGGESKKKDKYEFMPPTGELFYMAGIYRQPKDSPVPVFAIVTTEPDAVVRPIHDRMPVILWEKAKRRAWMAGDGNLKEIFEGPAGRLLCALAG